MAEQNDLKFGNALAIFLVAIKIPNALSKTGAHYILRNNSDTRPISFVSANL